MNQTKATTAQATKLHNIIIIKKKKEKKMNVYENEINFDKKSTY